MVKNRPTTYSESLVQLAHISGRGQGDENGEDEELHVEANKQSCKTRSDRTAWIEPGLMAPFILILSNTET